MIPSAQSTRRMLIATGAAILFAPPVLRSQALPGVRLMVLRHPAAIGTTNCIATCIRGSLYDVSHEAGFADAETWPIPLGKEPICDVIERPWLGNKPNVSSIPAGEYTAKIRKDASKSWMNTLNKRWRLELTDNPEGRSFIQFHYGLSEKWSQGCLILGDHLVKNADVGNLSKAYCQLENSEAAVGRVRKAVMADDVNIDDIRVAVVNRDGLFLEFTIGC